MPTIRLVAIDLDGTLLNDAKAVSERTAAALRGLPGRGVKAVIASARPPRSVRHIYRMLHLDTWQINYNGALIWDEPAGRAVFHQPMSPDLTLRMIHHARALHPQVLVSCEILDQWHTDQYDAAFASTFTTETGRLFKPDVVAPVESWCNQPITKLLFLGEPAIIAAIKASILAGFPQHISVIHGEPDLLQIMDGRAGKAAALRMVAEHYGVPLAEVLAIGDAVNDMDMLQSAGVAIAMDNAHPSVKQVAHWIAPSNNDHGVHAALARYGLCD
jgi:hypothetical protein